MNRLNYPCQICNLAEYKYTCPKCNIHYCSVNCYKAAQHVKCTEQFYKSCVLEELAANGTNDSNDVKKMYKILERMQKSDAGEEMQFSNGNDEVLDSDDDSYPDEEEDLLERLKDIDLDNADEVWKKLTEKERADFLNLTESGDILKLIPAYKAWWELKPNSKIVVLTDKENIKNMPKIVGKIPEYAKLCQKEPSPCLEYNLFNIFAAYTATVRHFSGEHQAYPFECLSHFVNLSATFKYGTNFEDTKDAIKSVEMEALTTLKQNGAETAIDSKKLQEDVQQLMSTLDFKLAALSDVLDLMEKSKEHLSKIPSDEAALYALTTGTVLLDKKSITKYLKKTEFYLSYVNRENELNKNKN